MPSSVLLILLMELKPCVIYSGNLNAVMPLAFLIGLRMNEVQLGKPKLVTVRLRLPV